MFGSLIFLFAKNIEFRRQLLAVGIAQDTKESPCESLNRKMLFHPRLLWPKGCDISKEIVLLHAFSFVGDQFLHYKMFIKH